jgi:hypothetical protein
VLHVWLYWLSMGLSVSDRLPELEQPFTKFGTVEGGSHVPGHDAYGKGVVRAAAGSRFVSDGPKININYGAGFGASIDGVVGETIAVEIESRVSKQVRGAVLDLICHPYPKKLLILLPVHMQNPEITRRQCNNILERFLKPSGFRVVLLTGSGHQQCTETDIQLVRNALRDLGMVVATGALAPKTPSART